MIRYLQRRYALSRKGAVDNIKGMLCCALQNISFMLPVGLLYLLVDDIMRGTLTAERIPFYAIGCIAAALFIVICTRLEYDNTFLVTYVESGVRRVGLAEKLRKIPLSFFGKKDLADLTSSIMNDCAVLEQSQSHFVAPLYGAMLSTTVIAVSMLFFNWRMALAAIWPLPVAFAIVALASGVQKRLSRKATAAKVACEDGVQECIEAMPDLRANNAESAYLAGLEQKIRAVESRLHQERAGNVRLRVVRRACPAAGYCHYRPHGRIAAGQGRIGRFDLLHVSAGGLPPVRSFGGNAAKPRRHHRHEQQHRADE